MYYNLYVIQICNTPPNIHDELLLCFVLNATNWILIDSDVDRQRWVYLPLAARVSYLLP